MSDPGHQCLPYIYTEITWQPRAILNSEHISTMSFVGIGDIASCAKFAYRVYLYGFSKVKNACNCFLFASILSSHAPHRRYSADLLDLATQYTEFGQDVYRLHENLGQVEKVFKSVQESARGPIPQDSDFYNTSSLNSILDEPFNTIKECENLLNRRTAFAEDRGFIQNIYWNLTIESSVTALHNRVKFHNVKIIALLQPLQMWVVYSHITAAFRSICWLSP